MQVTPGRPAGRSDEPDDVALVDVLALLDQELRLVAVRRLQSRTVLNDRAEAPGRRDLGVDDGAGGRSPDRRATRGHEVDAGVEHRDTEDRVDPRTERRCLRSDHGSDEADALGVRRRRGRGGHDRGHREGGEDEQSTADGVGQRAQTARGRRSDGGRRSGRGGGAVSGLARDGSSRCQLDRLPGELRRAALEEGERGKERHARREGDGPASHSDPEHSGPVVRLGRFLHEQATPHEADRSRTEARRADLGPATVTERPRARKATGASTIEVLSVRGGRKWQVHRKLGAHETRLTGERGYSTAVGARALSLTLSHDCLCRVDSHDAGARSSVVTSGGRAASPASGSGADARASASTSAGTCCSRNRRAGPPAMRSARP